MQKEELNSLFKKWFSRVYFFHRDTELPFELLLKYNVGLILQERAFVDATHKGGGLARPHRFLLVSSQALDLTRLGAANPEWGMVLIQRNGFFKVLDIYRLKDAVQITLLHLPVDLVMPFRAGTLNDFEIKIIQATRLDFDQNIMEPAVPALTQAEWLERVQFPLGMNDSGELFEWTLSDRPMSTLGKSSEKK